MDERQAAYAAAPLGNDHVAVLDLDAIQQIEVAVCLHWLVVWWPVEQCTGCGLGFKGELVGATRTEEGKDGRGRPSRKSSRHGPGIITKTSKFYNMQYPQQQGIIQGASQIHHGSNVLHTNQGEIGGLLGQGIPQQGFVDPLRSGAYGTTTTTTTTSNHPLDHMGKKVRGTVTFRPIEARFNQDKDLIGKMDPYVKFKIGLHSGKSSVAKSQGTHPVWNDSIPIKYKGQEFAKIKVKDRDRLRLDDRLGTAKIPLSQLILAGPTTQWFPLEKKGAVTGEIQVEISYSASTATKY